MSYLSIDVGITNTGYCIFDIIDDGFIYLTSGYLSTKHKPEIKDKLKIIYDFFSNIIKDTKISYLIYEQPMFNRGRNGSNVIKSEGILLLLAGNHDLKVTSYTACAVKKVVTDDGKADKHKVEEGVFNFLKIKPNFENDHESDACAVGITHYKITKHEK